MPTSNYSNKATATYTDLPETTSKSYDKNEWKKSKLIVHSIGGMCEV